MQCCKYTKCCKSTQTFKTLFVSIYTESIQAIKHNQWCKIHKIKDTLFTNYIWRPIKKNALHQKQFFNCFLKKISNSIRPCQTYLQNFTGEFQIFEIHMVIFHDIKTCCPHRQNILLTCYTSPRIKLSKIYNLQKTAYLIIKCTGT